jgi:hypothetical protein
VRLDPISPGASGVRHILVPLRRTGGSNHGSSRHVSRSLPAAPGGGSFGHRHGCLARVLLRRPPLVRCPGTQGAAARSSAPLSHFFPVPSTSGAWMCCRALLRCGLGCFQHIPSADAHPRMGPMRASRFHQRAERVPHQLRSARNGRPRRPNSRVLSPHPASVPRSHSTGNSLITPFFGVYLTTG